MAGQIQKGLDFIEAQHFAGFFAQFALEDHRISLLLAQSDFTEIIRRHCLNMRRAPSTCNDRSPQSSALKKAVRFRPEDRVWENVSTRRRAAPKRKDLIANGTLDIHTRVYYRVL